VSAIAGAPPSRSRAGVQPLRAVAAPLGLAVVLFIVAVVPRAMSSLPFVTADEDNWMLRTRGFARAVSTGDFPRTYQSGHPGVVTMWVAWLGLGGRATRLPSASGPNPTVAELAGFMEGLLRARLAFVVANAALVAGIALLTWRLLGPGPAAFGGALMAFDPFLVAHGQVVHLDALSAGFITVAILSGAIYWWAGRPAGRPFLGLCAVATGLAVLTKAPSLFLGLALPAVALGAHLAGRRRRFWAEIVAPLLICGLGALATLFLLWPALWVAPLETISRSLAFAASQAGAPHAPGNFFLGRPTEDPGPAFYPVAVAFRLTPLVLVGLAALALLARTEPLRRPSLVLVGFVLCFAVFITFASKKLDRYALPLFPTLDILAGLGLWSLWLHATTRIRGLARPAGRWAVLAGALVVAAAQSLAPASVWPYPLAYYNPLLGGGPAAQQVILVGWGEGLDQVAAFLNAQPDAATAVIGVYAPYAGNFQRSVQGAVIGLGRRDPVDYVVDYVNGAQRGQTPPEVSGRIPDHTVWINRIPYARVYRFSPPAPVRRLPPVVREDR
jgi:4-amino-4-deoxy-L-arabinose transferase-like glycosyltransferase